MMNDTHTRLGTALRMAAAPVCLWLVVASSVTAQESFADLTNESAVSESPAATPSDAPAAGDEAGLSAEAPATQPAQPRPLTPTVPDFSAEQIADILRQDVQGGAPLPPAPPGEEVLIRAEQRFGRFPGTPNRPEAIRLIAENTVIANRRARLVRGEDGQYRLHFEREGLVVRQPPMRLIPNQLLEQMLAVSAGDDRQVFDVAGLVTVFQGENYLLLYRAAPAADLGNLQ